MRYASLDEFFNELDDDVTDPYKIANDFDCRIVESELPSSVYGFSEPISQYIVINKSIDKRFKYFVVAHELVHSLLDCHLCYLESGSVNTLKTEARANFGAYYLLIRNYIALTGFNLQEININAFMNAYHLPSYFYYFIEHYFTVLSKSNKKAVILQKDND